MDPGKNRMITFKADPALSEALREVPNRSAFIRAAVVAALEHACPLCAGAGVLTPEQKRHWTAFAAQHPVRECDRCHSRRLVCERPRKAARRPAVLRSRR